MVIALPLGQANLLFCFLSLGLLASIIGVLSPNWQRRKARLRAQRGSYLTCGIYVVLTFLATLDERFEWRIWGAAVLGMIVWRRHRHYQRLLYRRRAKPVEKVAEACKNGPAFTILTGMSYGLLSAFPALAVSASRRWRI
jgi:K(+)-stimulated pyrophosphate-energized sodium pump